MKPVIQVSGEVTLVGMVATGESLVEIDIGSLWNAFDSKLWAIKNRHGDEFYEIHVALPGENRHFCFVGCPVSKVEALPIDMFVKVVPGGKYAVFTHCFAQGSFTDAHQGVVAWANQNLEDSYPVFDVQRYDQRFKGADNPQSIVEICLPLD